MDFTRSRGFDLSAHAARVSLLNFMQPLAGRNMCYFMLFPKAFNHNMDGSSMVRMVGQSVWGPESHRPGG